MTRCPKLGLRGRIGVNTGVVVTTTDEPLATGDAMNVAARLEQAAEPGEVLIGAGTYALVSAAVDAETVEPLEVKGKAEPVPAYRLLNVLDAPERSHASRFVGREQELVVGDVERARAETRCELVTVVGEAGVGKSRLVAEVLAALTRASSAALAFPRRRGQRLAGGGDGEAARRSAVQPRRGSGDPLASR